MGSARQNNQETLEKPNVAPILESWKTRDSPSCDPMVDQTLNEDEESRHESPESQDGRNANCDCKDQSENSGPSCPLGGITNSGWHFSNRDGSENNRKSSGRKDTGSDPISEHPLGSEETASGTYGTHSNDSNQEEDCESYGEGGSEYSSDRDVTVTNFWLTGLLMTCNVSSRLY